MYNNDIITSELPDVLKLNDGSKVQTADDWARRRKEILDLVIETEYGGMPPEPEFLKIDHMNLGYRREFDTYRITTGTKANPYSFAMRVLIPAETPENKDIEKFPVIVTGDGCWMDCDIEVLKEASRRGYAIAMFDRTEIAHDGYHERRDSGIYTVYPDMHFSAISAWAWAYMRCIDALMQIPMIDTDQIAVSGHSRGGKTVLLAGALDERIKYTNPNCSGTHGCGCYRYIEHDMLEEGDKRSEPLCYLLGIVPYWLGPEMKKYAGKEDTLPYDMHFVKALVAPRYLLETSGYDDTWSNPRGSYYSFLAAKKVFDLLGVGDHAESWYRTGGHRHKLPEFRALMDFIDKKRGIPAHNEDFVTVDPYPGLFE